MYGSIKLLIINMTDTYIERYPLNLLGQASNENIKGTLMEI